MPLLDPSVRRFGAARRGEGARRTREAVELAKLELARYAWRRVHAHLRANLRNPTGQYQGRVIVDRSTGDPVVTDQGSVKGPWLEGTSSRNQTTPFKGYRSFRQAGNDTERAARVVVQRVLGQALGGR